MDEIVIEKEFTFKNPKNIVLKFYADDKYYTTTIYLGGDRTFFCGKVNHNYSDTQKIRFRYGSRGKDKHCWVFDLRVDERDGHLNFDNKIDGHSVNTKKALNQSKKRLNQFFLHQIDGIPKKLRIEIWDYGESDREEKIKAYNLSLS